MYVGGLYCSPSYFCIVLYCNVQYHCTLQYSTVQHNTVSAGEHGRNLLLSGAHSLKERFELHESFFILGLAQLLHELLSEVCKETEELVSNHGVVSIFVVQLQDLH